MKNVHLIQTDKPSRLWTNNLRRRLELDEFPEQHPNNIAKHIYITSDEEIKKEDYVVVSCSEIEIEEVRRIKDYYNEQFLFEDKSQIHIDYCKKIILTTDPTLIADGVQAIDDEFLQWFVNNPTCEDVVVEKILGCIDLDAVCDFGDKPCPNSPNCLKNKHKIIYTLSEPLQETIEEAGVAYAKTVNENHTSHMLGFYNGAKWAQKKIYEIMDLYTDGVMGGCTLRAKEWFEKYKTK